MFDCMDCGVNTSEIKEYYTLVDEVWLRANPKDFGMLCLACVENRLGRLLTRDDFDMEAPINLGVFGRSERMLDRLGESC